MVNAIHFLMGFMDVAFFAVSVAYVIIHQFQ